MEKLRFVSFFVDLFVEFQNNAEPYMSLNFLPQWQGNVNAPYGKAINIFFGKLLFSSNQHELSFVDIKFKLRLTPWRKHVTNQCK